MSLRIDVFDVGVTVRRAARPWARGYRTVAQDLGAKYATSPIPGVAGVANAHAKFLPERPRGVSERPSVGLDGRPWTRMSGDRIGRQHPPTSVNSGGIGRQLVADVRPLRPKTPEPERYLPDTIPRFVAPPISAPEPKPFAQPGPVTPASSAGAIGFSPLTRSTSAGATEFSPLFKLMEKLTPRTRESDADKVARIRREDGAGTRGCFPLEFAP